jgi:hypothetical protein
MTITISRDERTVDDVLFRERTESLDGVVDHLVLSDGVKTEYEVIKGFKPFMIFVGGEKYYEGETHDYTVAYDGFVYTVIFNDMLPPPVGNMSFVIKRSN